VKSRLIQGSEYYPFGMQTANSWTREAVTGNNYLANGGTELNATTQLYDLEFRNYDPALGRMFQVDPVAAKYASLTPYNYSFNNPTAFSDVTGADPNETVNYSAMNTQYYTAYTYDDRIDSRQTAVWYDAMGWRNEVPGAKAFYGAATGAGSASDWRAGLPMSMGMFLSQAMESSNGGTWSGGETQWFVNGSEAIMAGLNYTNANSNLPSERAAGNIGRGRSGIFKGIANFFKKLFGSRRQELQQFGSITELHAYAQSVQSVSDKKIVVGLMTKKSGILAAPYENNNNVFWDIKGVKSKMKSDGLYVKNGSSWQKVTNLIVDVPDVSEAQKMTMWDSDYGLEKYSIRRAIDFRVDGLLMILNHAIWNWPYRIPMDYRWYDIRSMINK
jgi:RHS repeat-associated protein